MTVLPGIGPAPPESLKDLDGRSGEPVELPAEYPVIREYLLDTLQAR